MVHYEMMHSSITFHDNLINLQVFSCPNFNVHKTISWKVSVKYLICAVKHIRRINRGLNGADIILRCHLTGSSHDLLLIFLPWTLRHSSIRYSNTGHYLKYSKTWAKLHYKHTKSLINPALEENFTSELLNKGVCGAVSVLQRPVSTPAMMRDRSRSRNTKVCIH